MESFDSKSHNVKEKSVYLLHLDTPRIILIASVIIGVIAASFLFGMNFTGKSDKGLSMGNAMIADNKNSMMGDGHIPPAPDGGEISDGFSDKNHPPEKENFTADAIGKSDKDILTADNIKEIIQPPKDFKKTDDLTEKISEPNKKNISRAASDEPAVSEKKKKKKTAKKEKNVVEVADSKKSEPDKINSGGFAIQIGAFDKRNKADNEIKNLKDLKYDSYLDKTSVSGKTYFRVRVGPVKTKSAAISLMGELQDNPRYQNCYIIRE